MKEKVLMTVFLIALITCGGSLDGIFENPTNLAVAVVSLLIDMAVALILCKGEKVYGDKGNRVYRHSA